MRHNRNSVFVNQVDLNAAFKKLRKLGLIARQSLSCCQSCAGYEIATDIENLIEKGKKTKDQIKGVVFYHRQDSESKDNGWNFHLAYGNVDTAKCGTVGLPTVAVGNIVVEVLREFNIPYEWDGTEDQRIVVVQESPIVLNKKSNQYELIGCN